jgi:hypothetical protein
MSDKNALDKVVYEAELMEEPGGEPQMPVPQKETLPAKRTSFQLGKAAGSMIALLGFFNEIRNLFKRPGSGTFNSERGPMAPGAGRGRGGGRGRRKQWKQTKRGKCSG